MLEVDTDLYLSFVCPGKSRLLYCLDRADKSVSPFPEPPLAGSNVGLAAVVIAQPSIEIQTKYLTVSCINL